jgi:hypothetical protein
MRLDEAPPAGWYPDPQGGLRLRWWDGTDWSHRYRARPGKWELDAEARRQPPPAGIPGAVAGAPGRDMGGLRRQDAEEIISQVRQVARSEIDRAVGTLSNRATVARREIEPLISQYTNRLIRWIKLLIVIAIVALVGWIVFQVVAEVTFFEWIGDRIDNLTDE